MASKYRTLCDQAGIDVALGALAAAQHGAVALLQLVELGLSASAVRSRVATGRLHRAHRSHRSPATRDRRDRSTTLRPEDVTQVRGIPCTTVARTILDVAEVIRPRQLEAVFEQADQEVVLDLRALKEQFARNLTRVGARRVHRTQAAVERDRRNDQRLTVAGFQVVRMTYRQIHREPARMVAIILELIDRAAGSAPGSRVPSE